MLFRSGKESLLRGHRRDRGLGQQFLGDVLNFCPDPFSGNSITVELRQSSKFIKEYKNPKFADFLRIVADVVTDGQKRGEFRKDLSPPLLSRALFGALDEIARAHLVRGGGRFDLGDASKELASLFLAGLRVVSAGP